MDSFKVWIEEKGLADMGMVDQGPPKIRNKKFGNKIIPDIPTYSFERNRGNASKVEALQVGQKIKIKASQLPKYTFDVTKTSATRMDPGSEHG